ncbi:efflux RND transporter periplasmic adaptor subunit [Reyranella sp.]|uniref:efflux RND transporter periplasmic adaptor subunit n=1 Tax=Reyranella sp. TaxID=1929291 RepID=UPI003BA9E8A8
MKLVPLLLRFGLPALAIAGVAFAAVVASQGAKAPPVREPAFLPPSAPFAAYIAGAGLIEAADRNIEVATAVSGVVAEVYVKVGQQVAEGTPLFRIEGDDAAAEVRVKETAVAVYEAKIPEAEAALQDYRQQLQNIERITDRRAVSAEEIGKRQANVAIYASKLKQARADLDNARAQLEAAKVAVERRIVRSPISGQVLQLHIRKGEYLSAAAASDPPVLVGNTEKLAVRVDIDENDAWRFKAGARARVSLRGNRDLSTDLAFAYVEPYVRPKTSLTGASTERVDTRVLQVLYTFDRTALPAYIGQQVDVFIEAPSHSAPTSPGSGP